MHITDSVISRAGNYTRERKKDKSKNTAKKMFIINISHNSKGKKGPTIEIGYTNYRSSRRQNVMCPPNKNHVVRIYLLTQKKVYNIWKVTIH